MYLYSINIDLHTGNYQIWVIGVRSYKKDPTIASHSQANPSCLSTPSNSHSYPKTLLIIGGESMLIGSIIDVFLVTLTCIGMSFGEISQKAQVLTVKLLFSVVSWLEFCKISLKFQKILCLGCILAWLFLKFWKKTSNFTSFMQLEEVSGKISLKPYPSFTCHTPWYG